MYGSRLERDMCCLCLLTDETCTEADVTAAADTNADDDDASSLTRLLVKTGVEVGVEDAWLTTSLLVLVRSTDAVVVAG